MCKVSFKSKSPTDFVRSLETGDQDKPVNSSALRKEFQVESFELSNKSNVSFLKFQDFVKAILEI